MAVLIVKAECEGPFCPLARVDHRSPAMKPDRTQKTKNPPPHEAVAGRCDFSAHQQIRPSLFYYLPVPVATSSSTFSETICSVTPFGLDFMFEDQFVAWPRLTSMM